MPAGNRFDSPRPSEHIGRMLRFLACGLALLLAGCATPIGNSQWSSGGVRIFEISPGRFEILVVGNQHRTYDDVARLWKRKAEETAIKHGATSYDIVSFDTGREAHSRQIASEGGFLEQQADDFFFWFPRTARGIIQLN